MMGWGMLVFLQNIHCKLMLHQGAFIICSVLYSNVSVTQACVRIWQTCSYDHTTLCFVFLFMKPLLSFHCRHFSSSYMFLFTLYNSFLLCSLLILKRSFISHKNNYNSDLSCELTLCVQTFMDKEFLAKSLVNRECYWP